MKKIPNAAYTLEFKLEALRQVRDGEPVRKTAREIGVPEQSIRIWVKAQAEGKLGGVEKGKPITPEQGDPRRADQEAGTVRDSAQGNRDDRRRCHSGRFAGPLSPDELRASIHLHAVPPERFSGEYRYAKSYAWVLEAAIRLARPIRYRHPNGAVKWVNVDPGTLDELSRALQGNK